MSRRGVRPSSSAHRPGRKTGTRGVPRELRERSILQVAGQVFARDGYHSASMDDIALEAGISKPMLYTYFGSKEGLYVAYISRTGAELLDRLVQAGGDGLRPMPLLRARVIEFLAFVEEHQDGWRVLFRASTSNQPIADEVAGLRTRIAAAVREMLEDGAPVDLGLAGPSSEGIAHAIVGAGESLANWWLLHPEVTRDEVAAWYVQLIGSAAEAAAASRIDPTPLLVPE